MRHIEMTEKIIRAHRVYFEKNIAPKFCHPEKSIEHICLSKKNKGKISITLDLKQLIYRMYSFFSAYWEKLAIGNVVALRELRSEWEKDFLPLPSEYESFIQDALLELFGYDHFRRLNLGFKDQLKVFSFAESAKWSPYTLCYWLELRVCPYCNRQYITPIITKTKRLRADLDHFWPKSKYPIFSMSLYNLIPSCKFCNSSLKHEEDPGKDALHPYHDNYDDYFTFGIDGDDFLHPKIKIDKYDDKIKKILTMFSIEDQYKYHSNIVENFYIRRQFYQPEFIRELLKDKAYENVQEILSIIIGYPVNKEKITEDALGKLKRDLAILLKFTS